LFDFSDERVPFWDDIMKKKRLGHYGTDARVEKKELFFAESIGSFSLVVVVFIQSTSHAVHKSEH